MCNPIAIGRVCLFSTSNAPRIRTQPPQTLYGHQIDALCPDVPAAEQKTSAIYKKKLTKFTSYVGFGWVNPKAQAAFNDVKEQKKSVKQIFDELDLQPLQVDLENANGTQFNNNKKFEISLVAN